MLFMQPWGLLAQPSQFHLHCSRETLQAALSLQAPVDENCGGTLDSGFPGPLDVLLNLTPHTGCHALGIESALVQIEEGADLFHLGLIELAVVGEKSVMKVPEPTLGMCRQGCSGSLLGKFMTAQGEVLENEFDLLGVFLEQLLEYRREPGAVGSLINRVSD